MSAAARRAANMAIAKYFRDPFKWFLFEIGAGYYARKLATGPEADIRRDFVEFLNLAPVQNGNPQVRLLDVGCGPGHVTRALARRGYDATGVDRSVRLLQIARRNARREGLQTKFERSSSDQLPFADASFDCAIATGVIYWVEYPLATLREMVRVVKPGSSMRWTVLRGMVFAGPSKTEGSFMSFQKPETPSATNCL